MDPATFEAANRNPELRQALEQQARRERAEAIHRLIIVPVLKLFRRHAVRPNLGHPRLELEGVQGRPSQG
jgi:hypothetical protein